MNHGHGSETKIGAMQIIQRNLSDIVEIIPKKHEDARGYFSEVFRDDWFRSNVAEVDFFQENQSLSRNVGTIRGLHFQSEPFAQGKLVRCLAGLIFDVAVDIRQGSPTFGHWIAVELSPEKGNQLWIPAGFAHGFCTLLPDSVLCYKVTAGYSPENDLGLAWNDASVGIEWPAVAAPDTLSGKDRVQPMLSALPRYFDF